MTFQISEYTKRIDSLIERATMTLGNAGLNLNIEEDQKETIRMVFVGQYSAGKSTILQMLTGRTDITIGAGITTQKAQIYEWNGLELIDTPGIHTELRPDHDMISYEAIASADMLVFVITNELFDNYLADHFRKLAIDKDKAGEMILVVNKMERADKGNTPEQQDIIRNDLRKVLAPYTPEQLNLCFLDAESYIDSLSERKSDLDLADELEKRSGYTEFIETINSFVKDKGLSSKATTILYLLDERLQKAIQEMEPQDNDEDIAALEEHYLQQRHILTSTRLQLQHEISALYTSATAKIRGLGLDAANLLVAGCNQDDVETQLSDIGRQVEQITMQCQYEAEKLCMDRLTEMGQHVEDSERTEFTQNLKTRLSRRFDTLPENVKKILVGAGPGLQKAGQAVANKAYNAGIDGGLKLTNFSSSKIHEWIIKAGHVLGHKFKPWQAIKWTKGIAVGGKILSILGVGVTVFMQIKSDQDEDRVRAELQRNRQSIRSQFNCVADDFDSFGKKYLQECVNRPFEEPIQEIDISLKEIRNNRKNKTTVLKTLEEIQYDCHRLIQEIHDAFSIHER